MSECSGKCDFYDFLESHKDFDIEISVDHKIIKSKGTDRNLLIYADRTVSFSYCDNKEKKACVELTESYIDSKEEEDSLRLEILAYKNISKDVKDIILQHPEEVEELEADDFYEKYLKNKVCRNKICRKHFLEVLEKNNLSNSDVAKKLRKQLGEI